MGLNVLEALLMQHARTPSQHARAVLEGIDKREAEVFAEAVGQLSRGALVNDAYFIVAGVKAGEGAVIARDRNGVASLWTLEESEKQGGNAFFMLDSRN